MFDRDNPHAVHEPTNDANAHFGQQERLACHADVKHSPTNLVTSDEQPGSSVRGQIDTGATASCSDAKHSFHKHQECNGKFKSPVQLCAAVDQKNNDGDSSITPEGEGHLLVPAINCRGCTPVRAHHSPHLTSTPTEDNCIMGATKSEQDQFKTQSLVKHFSASSFSMRCHHRQKTSKNIQVDGVSIHNKCFTHPLSSWTWTRDTHVPTLTIPLMWRGKVCSGICAMLCLWLKKKMMQMHPGFHQTQA